MVPKLFAVKRVWTALSAVMMIAALTGCPVLETVTPETVTSTVGVNLTLNGARFKDGAEVTFTRADGVTVIGTVPATYVSRQELTVVSPTTTAILVDENVSVTVVSD